MKIVDQYQRKINYLRISVTDRCDLRCVYCMNEKMTFLPKKEILSLEEIERMCDNFIDLGVTKIRLTGGEPLIRKDLIKLIHNLNLKKNDTTLNEITLTTNGTLLEKFSDQLKENGINRINISLDTIQENKYNKITRFGKLSKVINGIYKAKNSGIKIKINVVAIKNFNEDEFEKIIFWSNKKNIDVSFIEIMPMNETEYSRHLQFVPLNDVFSKLNKRFKFFKTTKNTGGPSLYYNSKELKNNIGFITPLSNNFCENCNRVRITSTGRLYMCLGQNDFIDFKDILRNDYGNDLIKEKILYALKIKPKKHDFIIEKNTKPYISRFMNVTGG